MLRKWLPKAICISCMYLLQCGKTDAQTYPADTVRLTIQEAEKTFLEKNLSLLAQHYNVEASKALIQQARLWANPVLATDQNVYANDKWFEHGVNPDGTPQGQVFVQVQQLIKTAGKRGKQVNLAKTTTNISEWQFRDVMRNLKYQLRNDFYTAAQLQGNQQLYVQEQAQLDKLLVGMNAQLQAGNISQKDFLRVQALRISLLQEMTENDKSLNDTQTELKTLLQMTGNVFIVPVLPDDRTAKAPDVTLLQLVDTAKKYNTDYQLQVLQSQYQRQNLSYQKALAVPDVTLSPSYDLNSNYAPRYVGIGIGLPIPLIDRNQGNIRSARWQVKQEDANLQQVDQKLQNDVLNAYQKLQYTLRINTSDRSAFYTNYYKLFNNVMSSYKERQISLLEFIDYFNGYEDIREKQLQQELSVQLAKEELNYQTGIDVVE